MPIILQVLFKIVLIWWPPSGPPCIHHVELSPKLTFSPKLIPMMMIIGIGLCILSIGSFFVTKTITPWS